MNTEETISFEVSAPSASFAVRRHLVLLSLSTRVDGSPFPLAGLLACQIKADLERHLIGDYSANLPPPRRAAACKSWLGCTSGHSEEPFDSNEFWREKESEPKPW